MMRTGRAFNAPPLLVLALCLAGPLAVSAQENRVNDFVYWLVNLTTPDTYTNNGLTVFPIMSLPLGGEQAAMANAYTAVSRDISYLAANPGAGALQEQAELAAFHASIMDQVNLESIAWSDRWGDFAAGAYVKLLHSEFTAVDELGQQLASNAYVETMIGAGASYSFLRDYHFSGISVGAVLKLAYRSIPKEFYQHITRVAGSDQSAIGFMADIGVLSRFNLLKIDVNRDKNFSLGLAIKDLGPPVLEDPLNTTLSAGLAWQPVRPLTVSGDFNLPINLVNPAESASPGFAAGISVQFVNFAAVKGGVQLDRGTPRITLGADLDLASEPKLDMPLSLTLTYSLDLTTQFKIPDHLSIQARLALGDNGRQLRAKQVDELYISALVSASASDWERVIQLCNDALAIDPGFSPAKVLLTQAETSQDLGKQLESIRVNEQQK